MITIDPPIEKLTDPQKLDLIDQLEASLSHGLPEDWSPPSSHLEFLAEREEQERKSEMTIVDLDELERRVLEAKL